jgi:hypothetical protein
MTAPLPPRLTRMLQALAAGRRPLTAAQLARHAGCTTASVTSLLSRLRSAVAGNFAIRRAARRGWTADPVGPDAGSARRWAAIEAGALAPRPEKSR